MKRKKISKDKRYELSKFYKAKEDAADNWSWAPMAPGLICGWIGLYFSFRSWLADPYKNI